MVWTNKDLAEHLNKDKEMNSFGVNIEIQPDNSLLLTLEEYGDLPIILVVGERQIIAEVSLVERSEFRDPVKMDHKLLSLHKLLPLSTVGIEKINNKEFYVLFGSLSINSKFEVIVEELLTLARNSLDLVDTFEIEYKFNQVIQEV